MLLEILLPDFHYSQMNYSQITQRIFYWYYKPGHQCFVTLAVTFQQDFAHLPDFSKHWYGQRENYWNEEKEGKIENTYIDTKACFTCNILYLLFKTCYIL